MLKEIQSLQSNYERMGIELQNNELKNIDTNHE